MTSNTCLAAPLLEYEALVMHPSHSNQLQYYCCDYAVKPQHKIDSMDKIVATAMAKREAAEEESTGVLSTQHIARGRIISLVYHITGKTEISNVLAAYYMVINDEPLYTNVKFDRLFMGQATAFLLKQPFYGTLVHGAAEDEFIVASQIHDYTLRPAQLNDLNLRAYVKV
jgi:hypothetical protein